MNQPTYEVPCVLYLRADSAEAARAAVAEALTILTHDPRNDVHLADIDKATQLG